MSVPSIAASARISECFLSIQGEGPSVGHPAHFIRLQGCSVGCHWCDTKYTWPLSGGVPYQLDALERELRALGDADLLVLTGGEPLECAEFGEVVAWAAERWPRVEVETSGIFAVPAVPENVRWNWSPKLSSVTRRADETWSHYAQFAESDRFVCKVVVDSRDDWSELCLRVDRLQIPGTRVYVMPQGMRSEEIRDRSRWIVPLAIERGFRFATRLHVEIWGAKRGV